MQSDGNASRRAQRGAWASVPAVVLALAFAFSASSAYASHIAFDPISGFQTGGVAEDFVITSPADWLLAGSAGTGAPLALTINETSQCLKPASAPNGPCVTTGSLFSSGESFVSDVTWQVANTSGNAVPTLLWFTTVTNDPSYQRSLVSLDDALVTLDGSPVEFAVIEYSALVGGAVTDFQYLGFNLADFGSEGDDGVVDITFRYRVDSPMLIGGTPELALNAAQTFVPEPSTALLVGLGLVTLATRRNRSRSR